MASSAPPCPNPLHSSLRAITLPLPPLTVPPVPCLCLPLHHPGPPPPTPTGTHTQHPANSLADTIESCFLWFPPHLVSTTSSPCFRPSPKTDCPPVIVLLHFHGSFWFHRHFHVRYVQRLDIPRVSVFERTVMPLLDGWTDD